MSAGNGHIAVSLPDDQLPPQSLLETDSLLGKDESQPLPAVNKTDPSQPLLPTDSVFENDVSRPHFTADATQPLLTATHESANVSRQDYGTLHTEHRSAHQSSSPDPGGPGVRPDVMLLEGDGQRPAVDLRKYVFVSMGIPVVVSAPKEFKRNCILLSSLLYFLMAVLGLIIMIVTLRSENLEKDHKLFATKIATILSGLFFLLLEGYWLIVFWWSRPSRSGGTPLSQRDFSPLGLVWWLLSLYFVAVFTSLLTEVLRNFDAIFGSDDTDMLPVKAAFVCMSVCLYAYASIFLIMKLESCVARRWLAK